jgi:signal transduction histidine kinase
MSPELSAAVVHDLKNSLSLLEGELELMARRADAPAKIRELWMHAARMRLRMMEFLTLYQHDTQTLILSIEEHPLMDFLQHVSVAEISGSGPMPTLIADEQVKVGYFDARLVSLALQSALANARSFARAEIILGIRQAEQSLVFFVADDGPGPGHGATPDGTGLGMKVCEMVAGAHSSGAAVGFCSLKQRGPAGGAVFELHLPM